MRLMARTPVLEEVLPVVIGVPIVPREDARRGLDRHELLVSAAARVTHRGTSISHALEHESRRLGRGARARCSSHNEATILWQSMRRTRGSATTRPPRATSRLASSQSPAARKVSYAVARRRGVHARKLADAHPEDARSSPRCAARIRRSTRSTAPRRWSTRAWPHSSEARRALLEEGRDPLGEVRAVGDARELVELAVEVGVETVNAHRLVHQALGHGVGARSAPREARRERHDLAVERGVGGRRS